MFVAVPFDRRGDAVEENILLFLSFAFFAFALSAIVVVEASLVRD